MNAITRVGLKMNIKYPFIKTETLILYKRETPSLSIESIEALKDYRHVHFSYA